MRASTSPSPARINSRNALSSSRRYPSTVFEYSSCLFVRFRAFSRFCRVRRRARRRSTASDWPSLLLESTSKHAFKVRCIEPLHRHFVFRRMQHVPQLRRTTAQDLRHPRHRVRREGPARKQRAERTRTRRDARKVVQRRRRVVPSVVVGSLKRLHGGVHLLTTPLDARRSSHITERTPY